MLTLWLFLPPPHPESCWRKWDDLDNWLCFYFEPSVRFGNVGSAAFPIPKTIPARTILLEWKMSGTAALILNRKPSFQFCSEDGDHTQIDRYHPRCFTLHAQRYISITNTYVVWAFFITYWIYFSETCFFCLSIHYRAVSHPSTWVTLFFWIVVLNVTSLHC